MTTTPVGASPLRERVAEEIRALLARRRMSAVALGRQLGVSQTYVWRRLKGETAFDLDDLERIAAALGVTVADLLPPDLRLGGQTRLRKFPTADRPTLCRPKVVRDRQELMLAEVGRKFRVSDPLTVANLRSAA